MPSSPLLSTTNTEIISGLPWVTSSFVTGSVSNGLVELSFPWVTKKLTIQNLDLTGSLALAFTSGGLGSTSNHFWTLSPGQEISADLIVKDLWLKQTGSGTVTKFQVLATLTTTDVFTFPGISGSTTGNPVVGTTAVGAFATEVSTSYTGI